MSKAMIGKHSWAEMTSSLGAGASPVPIDESFEPTPDESDREKKSLQELPVQLPPSFISRHVRPANEANPKRTITKQRLGLPPGFVSRSGRDGRSVLLEDNIYCLSNGEEFIPQHPTGTLGGRRHRYALLTLEQYAQGKRGSVFIRTDGRIFDYSFDHGDASREMFDTGFTIHDLERTGRYAPRPQEGSRIRIVRVVTRTKKRGGAK